VKQINKNKWIRSLLNLMKIFVVLHVRDFMESLNCRLVRYLVAERSVEVTSYCTREHRESFTAQGDMRPQLTKRVPLQ
jgi:hypothetical protein